MNTDMLIRQFAAENGLSLQIAKRYILNLLEVIDDGLMSYGFVKFNNHFILKTKDVPERMKWSNLYHKYMKTGGYRILKVQGYKYLNDKLNQLYKRQMGKTDE